MNMRNVIVQLIPVHNEFIGTSRTRTLLWVPKLNRKKKIDVVVVSRAEGRERREERVRVSLA